MRTNAVGNLALIVALLVTPVSYVLAQAQPNSPPGKVAALPEKKPDGTWEGLKPAQQKILAPLESDWDYMLPESRKRWTYIANIYPKMSAQDQERLQSRMASWSNLSQKERRIARENYLASLKFPAEKKAEAWSAYQKLSDEQKKKLAESVTKKRQTAVSAPTLQQHPISSTVTLPAPAVATPTTPIPLALPAEESIPDAESNQPNN